MIPLFAIPIIADQMINPLISGSTFLSQPVDVIFYNIFLWFGWIPIVVTLIWGFSEIWLNERVGKHVAGLKYILLAIDVPSLTEQTPKALENLFSNLYGTKSSSTWKEKWLLGKQNPVFSFEIESSQGFIQFVVRTQTKFRDIIEAGIYAQYPDAEITEIEDYTKDVPDDYPSDQYDMWGAEMTLDKPSHYPIRTYVDFEDQMTGEIKDPLGYTLEQFAKMRPGEFFWFQMLIQPGSHDWQAEGVKHINKLYGVEDKHGNQGWFAGAADSIMKLPVEFLAEATTVDLTGFFGGDPGHKDVADPFKAFKLGPHQQEEGKAILKKTNKIGYGVKIRIVYAARKQVFSKGERAAMVKGILGQYAHLNLNKFKVHIPSIPKDDYFWQAWEYTKKQSTLMKAYKTRSWGIGATPIWLNTEELATLWHFPAIGIKAPLIKKSEARRAEPPVGLPITFLENVLPGFEEGGLMSSYDINPILHHDKADFPLTDHLGYDPLPDALPHVKSPTEHTHTDADDENFTPPNLPV